MKNLIYLSYINILKDRINQKNDFIQVLLGPRQVGKTTSTLKLIEDPYKESASFISSSF